MDAREWNAYLDEVLIGWPREAVDPDRRLSMTPVAAGFAVASHASSRAVATDRVGSVRMVGSLSGVVIV